VVRNNSILKADTFDAELDSAGRYAGLYHVAYLFIEECLGDG
jgi:hypothetical protein